MRQELGQRVCRWMRSGIMEVVVVVVVVVVVMMTCQSRLEFCPC